MPAAEDTASAAAPVLPAVSPSRTEPADWFWLPSWRRSLPLDVQAARTAGPTGRWLVFRDGSLACDALIEELSQRGATVISVLAGDDYRQFSSTKFAIVPDRRADYERLLATVGASDEPLAVVVHAWNVATIGDAAGAGPARRRLLAFDSAVHLCQTLAGIDHAAILPVLMLSADREVVIGIEAPCLERSLLLGPVYTMPLEVPFLRCRNIDLWSAEWGPQHAKRVADCLLVEAAAPDADPVVAYRCGHRWIATVEPVRLEAPNDAALHLRQRGTYLITGGTGGIGLTVARFLAATVQARLVLTARTALPDRSQWDDLLADAGTALALKEQLRNILALEAAGSDVMVVAADVADEAAMTAVIAATRERFGEIHGVVHAAGTLTAAAMGDKSPDDIAATLRPKVEGTLILDKLLADCDLDFLVLFSSISTAVGSLGMCDYTSANAFLDSFAKSGKSRASRRVISIGWDGWSDVGFAAAGSSANEPWIRTAIRPDEGLDALQRALAAPLVHVYVTRRILSDVIRDAAALARWMRENAGKAAKSVEPPNPAFRTVLERRPALTTTYVAPGSPEERMLAAVWRELLGIDGIGIHDDFFDLGGHSLLATRMLVRIQERFGTRLALRDVFDAPTIHRLIGRIGVPKPDIFVGREVEGDREEMVF
jgi:phthiocerol/phenolphthiocerol synthesis type-I polyketide synthase E